MGCFNSSRISLNAPALWLRAPVSPCFSLIITGGALAIS